MILNTKLQNTLTGMNKPIKKVNAYNGWDPLKQIILGNVMSPSFFEDVKDTKLRDLLQKLLYETQEDLDNFQHELEKAEVDVIRIPENTMQDGSYYSSMNDAMSKNMSWTNGGIPRPFITPRDHFITIGNQLVYTHVNPGTTKVINELIDAILQNIKNGHLNLKNIGSFKIISKKERIGRNPKTKKEYIISKRKSVSFKASKSLLSELNKFYE